MSAAEAPKSEQIQANVAAALSRLRGELGASSSPVAGTAQTPVAKTPSDSGDSTLTPANFGPLPAGPVRTPEVRAPEARTPEATAPSGERQASVVRPFEPSLNAVIMPPPEAVSAPEATAKEAPTIPGLFGGMRREPSLSVELSPEARTDGEGQADLLSGMEVPPAPPPPLAAFESEDEVGGRGRRMRNRIIAVLVLLIVLGGGAWAYLASHRTSGPVPVITADATPEKVKPADEGGMQVPNQNVQILENLDGGQPAPDGQAKVLPAPEQPVAPPSSDATAQPSTGTATMGANAPTVTEQPAAPSVSAPAIPSVTAPEPNQTTSQAPANEGATVAQTQQAAPEPSVSATAPEAPAAPSVEAPKAEAPKTEAQTTAPKTEAPKAEAQPAQTQVAAAPSAPKAVAGGSGRIQLAAVTSEAVAQAQWAKMQKAHPDLLGGLTLSVEKALVNGKTYYRIQAGPLADRSAAKELCTQLKARKQDCIVPR